MEYIHPYIHTYPRTPRQSLFPRSCSGRVSVCLSSKFVHSFCAPVVGLFVHLQLALAGSTRSYLNQDLPPALGFFSSKLPPPPSDLRLLPRGPNPIAITDHSHTYVRTTTARSSCTRSLFLHRPSFPPSLDVGFDSPPTHFTSQRRLRGCFVIFEGRGGVWSHSIKEFTEGSGIFCAYRV